jgi:CBS domain containing-hemolysin-like protein
MSSLDPLLAAIGSANLGGPGVLLLGVVALIVGSAFFSGSETALVSASHARLQAGAREGRRDARTALELLERSPRTLASILVGNNLCNVAATSVTTALAVRVSADYGPELATIVLTPVLLVTAEILPKAFFRSRPTRLLRRSAGALRALGVLLAPLVGFAAGTTRLLLAAFEVPKGKDKPVFGRGDLEALFTFGKIREEEGEPGGGPGGSTTLRMAGRALDLRDRTVRDAMVPLSESQTCPMSATVRDARDCLRRTQSRFLAALGAGGRVVGFVAAKALLGAADDVPLSRLVQSAFVLDADDPLDEVLLALRRRQQSIGLVRDREGMTLGVVTVEDVLEEIVGELRAAGLSPEEPEGGGSEAPGPGVEGPDAARSGAGGPEPGGD